MVRRLGRTLSSTSRRPPAVPYAAVQYADIPRLTCAQGTVLWGRFVLRGRDTEGSDLDILVDPLPGTTLFDQGGLQIALEELLGVLVDLLTPGDLPQRSRERVLSEAVPV